MLRVRTSSAAAILAGKLQCADRFMASAVLCTLHACGAAGSAAKEHSMSSHPIEVHPNVRAIASSKIREVANAGLGRRDVLPFWFGKPDETTPEFIRNAASAALAAGDTFYTHNYGNPPLREALAAWRCTHSCA